MSNLEALDKEITVTKLKAAGLHHRAQSVLAMAELVNEYNQLVSMLQRQIELLQIELNAALQAVNEDETYPVPVNQPVSTASPAPAA